MCSIYVHTLHVRYASVRMRKSVTVLVLGGGGGGGVVCLSVTTPAPTSLVSALKIRYVGVYLFSLFNVWINVMA